MATYSLDQAQKDVAALRGVIAHQLQFIELMQVQIDNLLAFKGEATPAVPASGFVEVYGNNASGQAHLKYVGDDGKDYSTGRLTSFAAGQTVSSTTFTTLTGMSLSLGIGTYLFRFRLFMHADQSAGQWQVEVTAPAATGINYSFKYESVAGVSALNVNQTSFSAAQSGPATMVLGAYWVTIEGTATLTASGSMILRGLTSNAADTWTVYAGSYMEAFPIV